MKALYDELVHLERELHLQETRGNRQRMYNLLHCEFEEIGRSGIIYNRQQIIDEFQDKNLPPIHSDQFSMLELSDQAVLLKYFSAHKGKQGNLHRATWRTSLWLKTQQGWQIRFHQGTPASD